ncbi:MAG: aldo/keto reductase [Cloacibacillus evryensis]
MLRSIAQKYNKTIAQIIIRWHVQNQIIPIIATVSKNHMVENLNIFDFELSTNDMANIQSLDENYVILKSNGIDNPKYIYNL